MRNVNLFARVALLSFVALAGCAREPDGSFVIDEETIEQAWDTKSLAVQPPVPDSAAGLSLNKNQPARKADIPPVPPGMTRVYGTLDSAGLYKTKAPAAYPGADARGSTFQNSVYGMLGPAARGGTAWYYADVYEGSVAGVRVYLNGFMNGVCDMRKPVNGGYGTVDKTGLNIRAAGPCYFADESGSTSEYAILISGRGDVFSPANGESLKVNYIIDNTGAINRVPATPRDLPAVYDYGSGVAKIGQ